MNLASLAAARNVAGSGEKFLISSIRSGTFIEISPKK
jgi:hypothetical protein